MPTPRAKKKGSENQHALEDNHRMPESFNALFRMVSLTAANTRRMFDVSVACVKLVNVSCAISHNGKCHKKLTEGRGSDGPC